MVPSKYAFRQAFLETTTQKGSRAHGLLRPHEAYSEKQGERAGVG